MNEQTKDKNVKSNDKINSLEECYEAQKALQYYKSEYEWISNTGTKEAIRQIEEEAMKIRAMFNGEKTKEQAHYLKYYYNLMIKKYWVESEQYTAVLMQNIRAKIAQIKQYEIDNLELSNGDVLKSFLGLDDKTKEARKTNRILQNIRFNGLIKEVPLNMQTTEQILANLKKHGNFVGITIPEPSTEQTALIVSNDSRTKAQIGFDEMVNKTLQEENLKLENKELSFKKNHKLNENAYKEKNRLEESKSIDKQSDAVKKDKTNYRAKEKGEIDK